MTFSIIILGVLLILTFFNVGESVWKKIGLNKKWLLILLVLTIILYFVPSIKINGISFTWVGFFIPLIFSFIIIFQTKGKKNFFKMFVQVLISFSFGIVYNLITFDVYESSIFQPYLILAIILGSLCMFIVFDPKRLYSANVIGILLSEVVFYFSRYSIYGEYYLTLGSEKVFAIFLLSFAVSEFIFFVARKFKARSLRKKYVREKRGNLLA